MTTYSVYHTATRVPFEVEADTPTAAILRAINTLDTPEEWEFDGIPLTGWIETVRLTISPLREV